MTAAALTPQTRLMTIDRNERTDVTVVGFLDRRLIDAATIEQIGQHLLELARGGGQPKLVLDFDKVEYLSSSMLNALIALEKEIKQRKGQLRLANLHADLYKVFSLMKLHKVLTICDSVEDALKSIRP